MSVQALSWVLDHSEATGSARLVLLALANHADKDVMRCWPSLDLLAREARLNRATVIRQIAALEAGGHVVVERVGGGRGRSNAYRIITDGGGETVAGCNPFPGPKGSHLERERVASGALKGRPRATRTVSEPSEEPKTSAPLARRGWSVEADELVRGWWDSLDVKPTQPFPAIAKVVARALGAGWDADELRRALDEVPVVSGGALDYWHRRQHVNGLATRDGSRPSNVAYSLAALAAPNPWEDLFGEQEPSGPPAGGDDRQLPSTQDRGS